MLGHRSVTTAQRALHPELKRLAELVNQRNTLCADTGYRDATRHVSRHVRGFEGDIEDEQLLCFQLAAPQGFEPRYADPESAVLPLNEGAVEGGSRLQTPPFHTIGPALDGQ